MPAWSPRRRPAGRSPIPRCRRYFAGLGASWIREHPGDAAALFARKLWLVAHRAELPLNYSYAYYERDEPTVLRWLPIGAWCLVPLGVAGLAARPRAGSRARRAIWPGARWCRSTRSASRSSSSPAATGCRSWCRWRSPAPAASRRRSRALRTRRWIDAAIPAGGARDRGDGDAVAARARRRPARGARRDGQRAGRPGTARPKRWRGPPRSPASTPSPAPCTIASRWRCRRTAISASAEAEVRRALSIDPKQPEAHAVLGQLLARAGRAGEARHHMLRAAAGGASAAGAARWILDDAIGGPETSSAVFAVAEVARTAAADAATLRDIGQHLLEARRGDLAEPYFLALDARYPRRADIVEALGVALLERGRSARAAQTLERAVGLDGARPSSHLHLAIAYVADRSPRGGARRGAPRPGAAPRLPAGARGRRGAHRRRT